MELFWHSLRSRPRFAYYCLERRLPSKRRGRQHSARLRETLAPGSGMRKVFVVAQIALSFIVVLSAGLLAGTLRNLKTMDLGVPS